MAAGYLIGIGLALLLYLLVWWAERDYYRRRLEVIKRKQERLAESRRAGPEGDSRDRKDSP